MPWTIRPIERRVSHRRSTNRANSLNRRQADRRVGEPPARTSRLLVLVVHDNPLMRDGLARLLAAYPDLEVVTGAEGTHGFMLQDATAGDIVTAMRTVAGGGVQFTRREQEIRDLIAAGLGNKEIAQQLNIATNTVKSHVHNMLGKLAALTPPDRRQGKRRRRGTSRRSYRFSR